jgi:glycosyltransferase involved in cell wall biosynthesis
MQPVIYVDARCLQDPEYRVRGIGQHLTSLLRTRNQSSFSQWTTIALCDTQAEMLPAEWRNLFDVVSFSLAPPSNNGRAVFLDGTPMTHDPRFGLRFVGDPHFFKAAVLYDFIPLDWPGYLPTTAHRMEYVGKVARLRNFDAFFPISEYSAWRLSDLLATQRARIHVTGAAVRRQLYDIRSFSSGALRSEDPYFVIVIGADPRKNAEVPVRAIKQMNLVHGRNIRLKIAGHYQEHLKRDLLRLAGHEERQGFLDFCPNVPDRQLMDLYNGAIATVVSSHIEGFSLPVVEPTLCGCPVVASSCAAHLELIRQPEALFPSHDAAALTARLEALLRDESLRTYLVEAQAHLATKYHENEVGRRFWNGLETAVNQRAQVLRRPKKPRVAFLSPYPPDLSDVALYTQSIMCGGADRFHSEIFSDSERPLLLDGNSRDAGNVVVAAIVDRRYSAVLSVLSNSSPVSTFNFFDRYGGPCILHDLRLVEGYRRWLGDEEVLRMASAVLKRPASLADLGLQFRHTEDSVLLTERILPRASHVIVQTKAQQAILRERYGVQAHLTTCCPLQILQPHERTDQFRENARRHLGVPRDTFLITTFGMPSAWNGHEIAIMALEFLRSWKIPAELYFAGDPGDQIPHMNHISQTFGVAPHVHCGAEFRGQETYHTLLAAADCALQLKHYEFGNPSTDLCNAISAALPCVATEDAALACDAPGGYVSTVPNYFSPLLVAEQLAALFEARLNRRLLEDECFEYNRTHNFQHYASRLTEILGVA